MLAQKMPLRRSLQVSTVIFTENKTNNLYKTDPGFRMLIGNTVFPYIYAHIDASLMSVLWAAIH